MNGYSILVVLPKLPISITSIKLNRCYTLTAIKDLPERLKFLSIVECEEITILPVLPLSLQELYLSNCINLQKLPDFPEELEKFTLNQSTKIWRIPKLPKGIKELNLYNCSSLRDLPKLPPGIQKIDLSGCDNLSIESVIKLLDLEENNRNNPNFQLIWPSNISKKIISLSIVKKAYQRYYSSNPVFSRRDPDVLDAVNYPTLVLFNRFTSENLGARGQEDVLRSAIEVARQILKNPEILEILDMKSTHYLQACINQPVIGFTEIAILMEIAKQHNITAKIEKAKIYRAQQLIKYNIRTLRNAQGDQVGLQVEAELGNAMLREVHKKLLADKTIEQAWAGIPENIANQRLIESFLTDENIQKISDIVKQSLSDLPESENKKSSMEVLSGSVNQELSDTTPRAKKETINFLCEIEADFWAKLVLTQEEQEKVRHETLKEQQKRIEELKEEIIDLDLSHTSLISQKNKELEEIEKNIENKRLTKLLDLLKQKTQELLNQKPPQLQKSPLLQRSAFAKPMEVISATTSETYLNKSENYKEVKDLTGLTYQTRRYDPAGGAFYDRSQDQSYFDDGDEVFLFHHKSSHTSQYGKSLDYYGTHKSSRSLEDTPENQRIFSSELHSSRSNNSDIDNQPSELINPDANNQSLHSSKARSERQSPDGVSADLGFIEEFSKQDQSKSSPLTRVPTRKGARKLESLTADFVFYQKNK